MSLALKRRSQLQAAQQQGNNFNNVLFYDLHVHGNSNSPQGTMVIKQDGKPVTIHGRYESVIFLTPLDRAPALMFHKKNEENSKERILSGLNFTNVDSCPANEYFQATKSLESRMLKGAMTSLFFPVLATRRQKEPVRYNGRAVNPVNWFELPCTHYIAENQANALRLEAADAEYPIHEYFYKIFQKDRKTNEKQEYHFEVMKTKEGKPIPLVPQVLAKIVVSDHPLLTDWIDKGRFIWDEDYFEMIQSFAIVRFQKFVNPETHEVFDYAGEYQKALDIFMDCKNSFPPPVEAAEDAPPADNDYADDIPF